MSDRLIELTVETPAFAEPTKVHVFLPAGYEAEPNRRWPVTYVLAGMQNNYNSFADFLNGEELTRDYPSIMVSPDGNSGFWSDWFNDGSGGPPMYETFVTGQLIDLIRKNPGKLAYATGSASHRAAAEIFKLGKQLDIVHAPYKSSPQAIADLLGGHVDTKMFNI